MDAARWRSVLLAGWVAAGVTFWGIRPTSSEPALPGPGLEAVVESCPTPDSLAQFLKRQIRFVEDTRLFGTVEYWQEPEEFLSRQEGDCEDYALLAQAVLRRQGREAFVFSLYGDLNYAHTVCVFREGDGYQILNQDKLIRTNAGSLEELASLLYPRWTWGAVAAKEGHRGRALREIHRSTTSS